MLNLDRNLYKVNVLNEWISIWIKFANKKSFGKNNLLFYAIICKNIRKIDLKKLLSIPFLFSLYCKCNAIINRFEIVAILQFIKTFELLLVEKKNLKPSSRPFCETTSNQLNLAVNLVSRRWIKQQQMLPIFKF